MPISHTFVNILVMALNDETLRKRFQEDFEGTMKEFKFESPLSKEDRAALKQAFTQSDVSGQCRTCDYDMSCGMRGFYR